MKPLFTLFFLLCTTALLAQFNFEEGYYINNAGQKVEGYINNADWSNHPKRIVFRPAIDAKSQTFTIDDIREFAIKEGVKYQRFDVEIDQSLRAFMEPDDNPGPVFKRDRVFLRLLVEGAANLYVFVESDQDIFFFNSGTDTPRQLIFKDYLSDSGKKRTNYQFRNQLREQLLCDGIGFERFSKMRYARSPLTELFVDYSNCRNTAPVLYERKKKPTTQYLSLIGGIDVSTLTYSRAGFGLSSFSQKLEPATGFRIGIAGEIVLPRNNDRWAIFGELSFIRFQTNQQTPTRGVFDVDYQAVEIVFAARHNIYFNEKHKLFVNVGLVAHAAFGSVFSIEGGSSTEIDPAPTGAAGIGYRFNEKIGIEFRLSLDRELFANDNSESGKFYARSVVMGYVF